MCHALNAQAMRAGLAVGVVDVQSRDADLPEDLAVATMPGTTRR